MAYRPHNEQSAHHVIDTFALPWGVIVPAMVLAVVATFFAAGYPARAITRMPVVSALAGRPAPPRQIHRSLVPGVVALVIGFVLFSVSGASGNGGGVIWLVPGLIALIVGIILVSPFFLALLARVGSRSPIAIRLPLRDMARYRARSGSALSAISLGIMIAVIICAVAVARYSNVFDFVGPNMSANTLNVYTPPPPAASSSRPGRTGPRRRRRRPPEPGGADGDHARHRRRRRRHARGRARSTPPSACRTRARAGRQWDGPIYVATPALLRAYGINPSSIPSNVDILSSRPGLAGSGVQLTFGGDDKGGRRLRGPGRRREQLQPVHAQPVPGPPRRPGGEPAAHRHVVTEHGDHRERAAPAPRDEPEQPRRLDDPGEQHDHASPADERQLAGGPGDLSIESKNDAPTSSEIVNWATVFGIALALGVLAMSVGLIRSETASDLRTLTATGASCAPGAA